jgi:two-component system response regulator HydG
VRRKPPKNKKIKEKAKILVVDDAQDTLEVLRRNLATKHYTVYTAPGVKEAISILESSPVDIVITDIKMPKISGLDLVRHVRENYRDTEIVVMTGYPSINGAVAAVKTGAEGYLTKPFTDEELFNAVTTALDKLQTRKVMRKNDLPKQYIYHGLIAQSRAMQDVFAAMQKAANTSATVLITGESGTGKELVARGIHYHGSRAAASFVAVNCGGIPEELLESELFGHVKGSFTGATESRAGFFQTADRGTIFLDEISETSAAMQVKLLRVLQDKEIYMVGSRRPQKLDVRIIAATNKDLFMLMKKGLFREDLYYRLNVITIQLPPLRERNEDILLLINYFLERFAKEASKPVPKFSDKALQVLQHYYWPGNVREMENVIQRLVVMTEEPIIDAPDLPSLMRFSALQHKTDISQTLEQMETQYITHVLESVNNNKSKAAKILGIDRKTLRKKLEQAGRQD